jgi:hypothetical protein
VVRRSIAPRRIHRKASGSVRPYSLISRPSTRPPDLPGSTHAARSARRLRCRLSLGQVEPDQGLPVGDPELVRCGGTQPEDVSGLAGEEVPRYS